jgi:sugar phosphate isomerase/epimerase
MTFSLSTRWNAGSHIDGAAMLDEIAALGFSCVELGYDTRLDLIPGIRSHIASGQMQVESVHNFCPVPTGYRGHPEIFSLSSRDERERKLAVRFTTQTLEFASDIGARAAVTHAGNVIMKPMTRKLIELAIAGRASTPKYEKLKLKLMLRRDKHAPAHIDQLRRSLEELSEPATRLGVCIALENLPSWEAIPTEVEMATLLQEFPPAVLMAWHDTGHGRIRDNLSLTSSLHWLGRFQNRLAGAHIHDVRPPACDHLMPPAGEMDFSAFREPLRHVIRVLEPPPGIPAEWITGARAHLRDLWKENDE